MCLEAAFSHLRSEIDHLLVLETIVRAGNSDSETGMVEVRVMRDFFRDLFLVEVKFVFTFYFFRNWARAVFLFSISELTCDQLVLNREKKTNKWCHSPSRVSVSAIYCLLCHGPLTRLFSVSCCLREPALHVLLFFICVFLSLFSVSCYCICLNKVGGTCLSCLWVVFLTNISDLKQRLHTMQFLSSLQNLRDDKSPKFPQASAHSGTHNSKFDVANLNEITKLSFCVLPFWMSIYFYLLFSSQKCIHTYTKSFVAICTFHTGGKMNVSKAFQSKQLIVGNFRKKRF